ncbi:MAG: DegT/DnrJ/EryC1/StrS family aminotransferase [Planctomycetota bacterium]
MIPLVDLKAQYQLIGDEIDAAIRGCVERMDFIQGKAVREFEQNFAGFVGAEHAIGCSSGTTAIYLALAALDLGPGDEVILPSHTFFASVEPILQRGAVPVFADIDPHTMLIDIDSVDRCITERTKAILPVHLYGQMADMEAILELAHGGDKNIAVIEDAAQAHGATQGNLRAGSAGDLACFSFYPGKNLGAFGDAGAVTTRNADLAERLRKLSDHGRKTKYVHDVVGYNYRIDTMQAAILNVKLKHLAQWNGQRGTRAELYDHLLAEVPSITTPVVAPGNHHAYHLYVVKSSDRNGLREYLRKRGIASGVHYPVPVHEQPAMQSVEWRADDLSQTEAVAKTILSLPMYPELRDEEVLRIAHAVRIFEDAHSPLAARTASHPLPTRAVVDDAVLPTQ